MISINLVRNTVMSLLNKNNRGYIDPDSFNLFSNMAQMAIFEDYFTDYNASLNRQNKRLVNTEYADLSKKTRENIDSFSTYSTQSNFIYDSPNNLWNYTGTDLYRTIQISLTNAQGKKIDIEEVLKSEYNYLINSNMTAPTVIYPIYIMVGDSYRISPVVTTGYYPELLYLRTPKQPKWTYVVNFQGNPVYNASDPNLQDFEIGSYDFYILIIKIMQYCGVEIREMDIVSVASNAEAGLSAKQQQ